MLYFLWFGIGEVFRYCCHQFQSLIKDYADARKRTHISVTLVILLLEYSAIMLFHDPMQHVLVATGISSWEAMVISIGEE